MLNVFHFQIEYVAIRSESSRWPATEMGEGNVIPRQNDQLIERNIFSTEPPCHLLIIQAFSSFLNRICPLCSSPRINTPCGVLTLTIKPVWLLENQYWYGCFGLQPVDATTKLKIEIDIMDDFKNTMPDKVEKATAAITRQKIQALVHIGALHAQAQGIQPHSGPDQMLRELIRLQPNTNREEHIGCSATRMPLTSASTADANVQRQIQPENNGMSVVTQDITPLHATAQDIPQRLPLPHLESEIPGMRRWATETSYDQPWSPLRLDSSAASDCRDKK